MAAEGFSNSVGNNSMWDDHKNRWVKVILTDTEFLGVKIQKLEGVKYRPDGLMNNERFPMRHWEITLMSQGGNKATIFFSTGSARNRVHVWEIIQSLVLDAESGTMSLEDFCSELGYEFWDVRTRQIYEACQKSWQILNKLFPGMTLEELSKKIQEQEENALAQYKA